MDPLVGFVCLVTLTDFFFIIVLLPLLSICMKLWTSLTLHFVSLLECMNTCISLVKMKRTGREGVLLDLFVLFFNHRIFCQKGLTGLEKLLSIAKVVQKLEESMEHCTCDYIIEFEKLNRLYKNLNMNILNCKKNCIKKIV